MTDRLPFLPPVDPARGADAPPPTTVTPEMLASLLADGDDELAAWTLRGLSPSAAAPRSSTGFSATR